MCASTSLADPEWELLDPCPDIHALFTQYNHTYFWGALEGCEVKWSPRMTLCAGLCCYEGYGGLCSIRLSSPLLQLRPRKDLVETLLHEMIHAYLFVTQNNRDREGHGPEFQAHMHRLNSVTGVNITIYHSFHDEVDQMRQHWWKCDGPCRTGPPYYGLVKRSMNRAPGPNDLWWNEHKHKCGGVYVKIKQPIGFGEKTKKRKMEDSPAQSIKQFFNPVGGSTTSANQANNNSQFTPFSGKGNTLGSSFTKKEKVPKNIGSGKDAEIIDLVTKASGNEGSESREVLVDCPACSLRIFQNLINIHLDSCLNL